MVLRQLPQTEKKTNGKPTIESVYLARQAVQLDVEDGTSWCECLDRLVYEARPVWSCDMCDNLQLSWEMPTCPCSSPVARSQSFLNKL